MKITKQKALGGKNYRIFYGIHNIFNLDRSNNKNVEIFNICSHFVMMAAILSIGPITQARV